MMEASEFDRSLGMELYATDSPGCGGRLRSEVQDFVVEELVLDQRYEGGRYLIVEVEKADWETHHLVRDLSRQLQISQKRFSWAGTKDKNAITRQRMSIYGLEEGELVRANLPGVNIRVLGRSNRGISLGDLRGNRFAVRIREIDLDDADAAGGWRRSPGDRGIRRPAELLRGPEVRGGEAGDPPRRRGPGEGRPRGGGDDLPRPPLPRGAGIDRAARERLFADHDFGRALKKYPLRLRYERAMMARLQEEGDFARSFDVLADNLKRLFVHAYQPSSSTGCSRRG
jgi:tRNA pseudouridine13 synthase